MGRVVYRTFHNKFLTSIFRRAGFTILNLKGGRGNNFIGLFLQQVRKFD